MSTRIVIVEVKESALKHGYTTADIRHAIENAIHIHYLDGMDMIIGPALNGELLEIGINNTQEHVFHAMKARPKYLRE